MSAHPDDRVVGVDLGTMSDFTAAVILDVHREADTGFSLRVVYSRRLRGLPWPGIVDELAAMSSWPALYGASWGVDATGVGRPVVDLLRQRIPDLTAVTITGGLDTVQAGPRELHTPKADLISNLQVLVQTGRLTVDLDVKDAKAIRSELLSFMGDMTATGRLTSGAAGGAHDDLVLALAIGAWVVTREQTNGAAAWSHYLRRMTVAPGPPARPTEPGTDADRRAAARNAAFRAQYTEGI